MKNPLLLLVLVLCGCQPAPQPASDPLQLTAHPDYAQVQPHTPLHFPEDHGSHPDFAVEWWYITANLTDAQGTDYALQWTLFRFFDPELPQTPWSNQQLYMSHGSLHSGGQSWFAEKWARGNSTAGVQTSPFSAFIDHWQWRAESENLLPAQLQFDIQDNVEVDLHLQSDAPLVLQGQQGYSIKFPATDGAAPPASYYYSQPRIAVQGKIRLGEKQLSVSGPAWFDHEWTSNLLGKHNSGWDWFALHLDNGDKLMLAQLRNEDGSNHWFGSLSRADGEYTYLNDAQIQTQVKQTGQVRGRELPLSWQFVVTDHDIDIHIQPMQQDQWVPGTVPYYEGAIQISGTHNGVGFLELTGY